MAQNIARLGVVLGIDTADFTKGINSAKKSVVNFVNEIPKFTAIGVAAFAAMTAKSMQFADHMSDLADANEMSISSILKMSEALEMSGGRAKDAGKLLASFTSKIDEAAQGSNSAQNAFSRIGISLKDIGKMSNEQLFQKTLDQLALVPDVVTRNALAFQVFGKAVRGVDMKAMAEEMAKAKDQFDKYEDAIRTSAELNDKLSKKTTMLMLTFNQQVLPTLSAMFEAMNQKGGVAEVVFEKLKQGLLGLWYVAGSVKNAFAFIGLEYDKLLGNISDIEYNKQTKELLKDQIAFKLKLRELNKPAEIAKKPKAETDRPIVDAQQQAIQGAKLLSIEFEKQQILKFDQLKRQRELVQMTTNEKAVAEAIYKIEDERFNKVADIQKKIAEEKAKKPADQQPKVIAELKEQIVLVDQVAEKYKKFTEEETKAQIQAQRTFSFGWNMAFKQYAEDATNSAKVAQDMFSAMTGAMNSALDNFVDKGKFSFRSLTESILKDLLKIALRASSMRMFSGLGSLLGGSAGVSSTDFLNSGASYSGFGLKASAVGGPLSSGEPSIVGERGPELFIPSRSGTIIPNSGNLSGAMSGQTINYNGPYIASLSAIDTQSASQFLAKNKDAVWAANQSANRSMPASR